MIASIDWQTFSLQLVTTFAHFLWQGVLIGVVLAVLLRLCSSRTANSRYIIASVAFASLPICVAVTFAVVHRAGDSIVITRFSPEAIKPTLVEPAVDVELPTMEIIHGASPSEPATQPLPEKFMQTSTPDFSSEKTWPSWLFAASPYLIVGYLVGVAFSLIRLGSSIWKSGRLRRAVKKIEDSAITRMIAAQATRMGLKRVPLLGHCDQIGVPVVVGIVKPTILLPPAILCGLDPQQLAAIVSHEMAHIRRYDLLVNLLQRVVEALLFFHPVTWWISRRMSDEREDCCDDLAVAGCGRLEFASALLHLAELCAKNRGLAIGSQLEAMAADGGKQSQLSRRVHRSLGEVETPRFIPGRSSVVLAVVATLMLTVSVLAFAPTDANQRGDSNASNDGSNDGSSTYDESKFARPPARYSHIVYDQSVPDPARGARPVRVMQPLPAAGGIVLAQATPFAEESLLAASLDRIRSAYPTCRPGESIEVKDNSVLLRNAITDSEKVLVRGVVRADNFARILPRVAVSPDGKRVAAAVLMPGNDVALLSDPLFDLYVFDLSGDEPRSKVIRTQVHGDAIMGGAFFPAAVAPPIFWSDDKNLLLVTPKPREDESGVAWVDLAPGSEPTAVELEAMGNVVLVRAGEVLTPTHDLHLVDLRDDSSKKVCDLKLGTFIGGGETSTDFWRRSDGAIMLRSRGTDTRIDLSKKEATTDRKLSPRYELRGDRNKPSLWYGVQQLAEVVHFRNVGVSPDGRSVAWYTRSRAQDTSNLGNTSQYPTTLWFHSPETGTVKLAEGQFAWENYWDVFDNPILNPRFHWLAKNDFVAAAIWRPAMGAIAAGQ